MHKRRRCHRGPFLPSTGERSARRSVHLNEGEPDKYLPENQCSLRQHSCLQPPPPPPPPLRPTWSPILLSPLFSSLYRSFFFPPSSLSASFLPCPWLAFLPASLSVSGFLHLARGPRIGLGAPTRTPVLCGSVVLEEGIEGRGGRASIVPSRNEEEQEGLF